MGGISCSSVCRRLSNPGPPPARSSLLTKNFPIVLYFPLQVVMCIWFLYNILVWSAFVGMAVMVALFPIPGTVAGKIQKVQKEAVKRVSILPCRCLDVGFTSRLDGRTCSGCHRK